MSAEPVGRVGDEDGSRYREGDREYVHLNVPAQRPVTEIKVPLFERQPPPVDRARPYPPDLGQSGPLRRLSPQKSWPEVVAFDERLDALDVRRMELGKRLAELEQEKRDAEFADKRALADWQVGGAKGERPAAKVPAIEAEIKQVQSEIDASVMAEDTILGEKKEFVDKHRKRLVSDAGKDVARAVQGLRQAIEAVDTARGKVIEAVEAQAWAKNFPSEDANATSLGLQLMRGGRTSKAIPELKSVTTHASVIAYQLDDAAWFDKLLADLEEDRPLDPHERAIWENTEEGRKAMALANERVALQMQPRDVREAAWDN
jgi:hypothetical protein